MPAAQMSWKACRRSRHWSSRAREKKSARTAVAAGRTAVMAGSSGPRSARQHETGERDPDLLEDLDRDEEAGEEEDHAEELPDEEAAGGPEAVRAAGDGRDQAADGDQDRGRDTRVEPPAHERECGAGERGDEVDGNGHHGDHEHGDQGGATSAGQRVADDALFGHEDVGAVERAERQGERPRDIEERREKPQVGRAEAALRPPTPPRTPVPAESAYQSIPRARISW